MKRHFVLLVLACSCCAAPRPVLEPELGPTPSQIVAPVLDDIDKSNSGPKVCVNRAVLADGLTALWQNAEECRWVMHQVRQEAGIDASVSAGELVNSQERISSLESQRWWWGGVGVVLGVFVAGVVAAVAR